MHRYQCGHTDIIFVITCTGSRQWNERQVYKIKFTMTEHETSLQRRGNDDKNENSIPELSWDSSWRGRGWQRKTVGTSCIFVFVAGGPRTWLEIVWPVVTVGNEKRLVLLVSLYLLHGLRTWDLAQTSSSRNHGWYFLHLHSGSRIALVLHLVEILHPILPGNAWKKNQSLSLSYEFSKDASFMVRFSSSSSKSLFTSKSYQPPFFAFVFNNWCHTYPNMHVLYLQSFLAILPDHMTLWVLTILQLEDSLLKHYSLFGQTFSLLSSDMFCLAFSREEVESVKKWRLILTWKGGNFKNYGWLIVKLP